MLEFLGELISISFCYGILLDANLFDSQEKETTTLSGLRLTQPARRPGTRPRCPASWGSRASGRDLGTWAVLTRSPGRRSLGCPGAHLIVSMQRQQFVAGCVCFVYSGVYVFSVGYVLLVVFKSLFV